jgi:hypothetical protein
MWWDAIMVQTEEHELPVLHARQPRYMLTRKGVLRHNL